MKRGIYFLLLGLTLSLVVEAQLVDSRSALTLSYTKGSFIGEQIVKDGNFIIPSFHPNFKQVVGASLRYSQKIYPHFTAGINLDMMDARSWSNFEYNIFYGSKEQTYTSSVFLQFHNKYTPSGIGNRLKLFVELAPVMGFSKFTTSKNLIHLQYQLTYTYLPLVDSYNFGGIRESAGIELALSHSLGLFAAFSIQQNLMMQDKFMHDNKSNSLLSLGATFRFQHDKRFYYYW